MESKKSYQAYYLGVVPYQLALNLQQSLVEARAKGINPDVLLLLQHPSVFTIGRFKGEEDIIVPPERLAQEGIDVFHIGRGGGITYHGPGQLIGYPILSLEENGLGVRQYVWKLESVIINLLHSLGIRGHRISKFPGVWVNVKKVCSIGVRVNHGITMHGFALNVDTDLRYFEYINPCGMKKVGIMTSISKILGYPIEIESIIGGLLHSFSDIFGFEYKQEVDKCPVMLDALSG